MKNIICVENVSKEYRLGAIGGATLQEDLQNWWARVRGRENPNTKIGSVARHTNERFLALDGVSFDVQKGEALGIIGHNGAGKSTLLKLISRITTPTKGCIYLNGTVASMLEVGTGFHPELTGRENIHLNGAILGMTKNEIDKKFDQIVEFSELSQFIDTPVKRYSSGMYVKLAFSVAAHLNNDIMIMDEVLAVGDVDFQKKCLGRMGEAASQENRTVLYVSHNISTIRTLCTRCLVLDHGKVSFAGDVETAISRYLGLMNEQTSVDFDLDKKQRRVETRTTSGVRMMQAHIVNKENNSFQTGEDIILDVLISAQAEYADTKFGFVVQYVDGARIGGTTSNSFCIKKGENQVRLYIPTDNIPDGIYVGEITIDGKDKENRNVRLDSAKSAISFSIINPDGIRGQNWQHNIYGHTMYRPAKIVIC